MEPKNCSVVLSSCLVIIFVLIAVAQSAPNNSTAVTVTGKPSSTPTAHNATTSGNKTSNSSDEDCEAEPEPTISNNATKTSGERQGKVLTPDDKDKYKHDNVSSSAVPEPISDTASKSNATNNASQSGGDAAKLQGNSSTTTKPAPAAGGATIFASSFANVIFATWLSSFAYSAL